MADTQDKLITAEALKYVSDELSGKIDDLGGGAVPDYWVDELATKADVIQTAMEKAGRNKSAFLWYTDAHWVNGNSKVSPILLNYLYQNTPMNKVNFGGDIIGNALLATREEMTYLYEWRKAIKGLPNHHSVLGNHDMFVSDSVDYENDNYRYAIMLAPEETSDMVMGDGNYYYIDNPCEKTRYLYLVYPRVTNDSTATFNLMKAQGEFIVNALKTAADGWHIVAIAHMWWSYGSTSNTPVGDGTGVPAYEQEILNVFDEYNARGTHTASNYFGTQDFADAVGKVEFCIGGHLHIDYDFATDGGIPVIITTSDANQSKVDNTDIDFGTVGTTTEAAVYGIIADYNDTENTIITVVGIGRGTRRVIGGEETPEEPDEPVSGENLFDNTDINMVDTGRFDSTGAVKTHVAGQLVTGYIPAQVGDTFTVTTDKANSANGYVGALACYDADNNWIGTFNTNNTSNLIWTWDTDYLTGTITVPSTNKDKDYTGTAFVRFCVAYTDIDNIVITKF